MANVKKGNITPAPQWWKHLKDWKRVFWKAERQAQKNMMSYRMNDDYHIEEGYADTCTRENPCPFCKKQ